MASARPTFMSTVTTAIGRQRQPMDQIGSIPSVVFDPEMMMVSHVIVHGSLGSARHLTFKEAVQKRYIEVIMYGHQLCLFIKSRNAQVMLTPSTNLMKQLQPSPSKGVN